jgi:hypothetical protein
MRTALRLLLVAIILVHGLIHLMGAAKGFGWADVTATQVYTVFDIHPLLADEIVHRGAASAGLTWHYARPPVRDLEYEMDCRAIAAERVI